MPIHYSVSDNGHFVHAVASGLVTGQEFIEYELNHAIDKRIKAPLSELLIVETGAFREITTDDISKIIEQRRDSLKLPAKHHCALVIAIADYHTWDLAKFYEGMFRLHYPDVVIIFSDPIIASIWLRMEIA